MSKTHCPECGFLEPGEPHRQGCSRAAIIDLEARVARLELAVLQLQEGKA